MTERKRQRLIKEIFYMVYGWGGFIKTDHKSFAYQTAIGELLENPSNGYHIIGDSRPECFIKGCKIKHLSF